MNSTFQTGLLAAILLAIVADVGLRFAPLVDDASKPKPIVIDARKAAHAAAVSYFKDVAASYKKLSDAPPKTVRESMDQAKTEDATARAAYWKRLADIMQPEIGSEDLDAAKAKAVFGKMALGFRDTR